MARRYDHTPDELRELAIRSGIEIIVDQGFSKLSARGVAAKMGYTVGTIYHLFGSIDLYILHINARTLDEWHRLLSEKLAKNKKDSTIHCLAKEYLALSKAHRNRFITVFEYQLPSGMAIPDWYKPRMQRLFELVETALTTQGMATKRAQHLAKVLWASIHGITILSLTGKLEVVGADAEDKLIETVLKGLLSV